MGIDKDAVPVAGFIENFSPKPRIAPPPFGKLNAGTWSLTVCGLVDCAAVAPPGLSLEEKVAPVGVMLLGGIKRQSPQSCAKA